MQPGAHFAGEDGVAQALRRLESPRGTGPRPRRGRAARWPAGAGWRGKDGRYR
ncbi:MAG: hypothetical protein M0C28_24890 [Candidatus Moduliflexus flocculans]|nr:hypothetical protein [Candidatus Moduliflexus flocculans]